MSRTAWKGMDLAQRIATLALAALALMALVAILSGCGGKDASGSAGSATRNHTSAAARSSTGGSDASSDLGTVQLSALPKEARHTVQLIDAGGPFPYSRDGVVFGNYEHQLPKEPRGWYHEYTVKTPGAANRGTRRIIEGKDNTLYYTGNHYKTFEQVQR